jgi:hypothetical protein
MIDPPTPDVIVATIPRWLGRRPICGETVLVGFSDYDDEHAVTITLDPERDPVDEVGAFRQAVIDGATDLAVIAYTGAEGDPRLEATLRFLASTAGRYQLGLLGVLVVVPEQRDRSGYWRNLPDPARHPLPTPTRTEETR